MNRTDRRNALVTALTLTIVSGCAPTSRSDGDDAATVGSSSLEPSVFVVSGGPSAPFAGAWTAVGATGVALSQGFPVRLEVSDGVVAATAGCQLITTAVTAASVDGPLGTTVAVLTGGPDVVRERSVRCAPDLNALDDWLAALLAGPMRWEESEAGGMVTAEDHPDRTLTLRRDLFESPTDPSTFADPGLDGSFALSQWSYYEGLSPAPSAAPDSEPAAAPSLMLTFAGQQITAEGICALATGDYRLTAGALEVQNLVSAADPACTPADRDFDDHVLALLQQRPILHRVGDSVSLDARTADGFGLTVNRVAVPADPDWEGVTWTLRDYQPAGADAVPTPGDVAATMTYASGRVSMYAGCNYMGGMAYIADGVIRATDVSSTAMSCGPESDDLDAALVSPFGRDQATYRVDGDTLTVTAPSITLTFTR